MSVSDRWGFRAYQPQRICAECGRPADGKLVTPQGIVEGHYCQAHGPPRVRRENDRIARRAQVQYDENWVVMP